MVDLDTRREALSALQRFLACETTNDEYENEYPYPREWGKKASGDPAIKAIHSMSWNWFDDFKDHKLKHGYELDPESQAVAQRCITFLGTSFEYEWHENNFISTSFIGSALTTLGLRPATPSVQERIKNHLDQAEGDASVWPFFRRQDFVAATQKESI